MTHTTLTVDLAERSYPIHIGAGALKQAGKLLQEAAPNTKRAVIVSDEHVAQHWLAMAEHALHTAEITPHTITLPAGEATKSFSQLQALLDQLLALKVDRHTVLVALGGGVVGDMTGFAASILLRGVPFVQLPTSLLAQVDSSVGGKTGINTVHGKNLVGSFYQPKMVLIDTQTLMTLPDRELRAGLAEVIKYGAINQPEFFTWLEENIRPLLARKSEALIHAIEASCQAKASIVAADERESGQRALLNLGHSFGHALESLKAYDGSLIHGEAVAIGMVMAFDCSVRAGHCTPQALQRLRALLTAAHLPIDAKALDIANQIDALMAAMRQDKKVKDGTLTLILARAIGESFLSQEIEADALRALWADYL